MQRPRPDLEKIRRWRTRPDTFAPLGERISLLQRNVERTGRRVAEFIQLWESHLPAALVASSRVRSIRGGVAQVVVDTSATLYSIDRELRDGAEARMRREFSSTLTRVRLSIGPLDDPRLTHGNDS